MDCFAPVAAGRPADRRPLFKSAGLDILHSKSGALVKGSQKKDFLAGFIPPLIVAAVIAVGLLIYYRQFGDSDSRYDSAMSNCVRQHTFLNKDSTAREEATASCNNEIPERP